MWVGTLIRIAPPYLKEILSIMAREISYFSLLGRTKEAWENYNKALQLNPTHAVAMVNMARQLRAEGKIRDAEITYKRFALTCINFI